MGIDYSVANGSLFAVLPVDIVYVCKNLELTGGLTTTPKRQPIAEPTLAPKRRPAAGSPLMTVVAWPTKGPTGSLPPTQALIITFATSKPSQT